VTRGRRYAVLPFLYDDEAAVIREEGAKFLVNNDAMPEKARMEAPMAASGSLA
jgi:hypothetical protein